MYCSASDYSEYAFGSIILKFDAQFDMILNNKYKTENTNMTDHSGTSFAEMAIFR